MYSALWHMVDIALIASLLCREGKQAIKNKTDRQTEHLVQGGSHKMLQRKKLHPRLMSGITFHYKS